jgi:hypothetical protein
MVNGFVLVVRSSSAASRSGPPGHASPVSSLLPKATVARNDFEAIAKNDDRRNAIV